MTRERRPRVLDFVELKLPPEIPHRVQGLVVNVSLTGLAVTIVGDDVPGLKARVPSESVTVIRRALSRREQRAAVARTAEEARERWRGDRSGT